MLKPEEALNNQIENEIADTTLPAKKDFIEPEITIPVDVLEATTFFQSVTSGATN